MPSTPKSTAGRPAHAAPETQIESAAHPKATERGTNAIKFNRSRAFLAVLVIALAIVAYLYFLSAPSRAIDAVTGAGTGFGHEAAMRLA